MASRFFMLHSIIFCWDAPHPSCFRAEGRTYRVFGRRSSLKSAFPKHCAICRIQYSIFFGKLQEFCVGFSQIYPYNDKRSDCGRKKGASEEAPRFFSVRLCTVPPDSRSRAAGAVQNAVQKAVLAVRMDRSPESFDPKADEGVAVHVAGAFPAVPFLFKGEGAGSHAIRLRIGSVVRSHQVAHRVRHV